MTEKFKLKQSLQLPTIFVVVIWLLHLVRWAFGLRLSELAVFPRHTEGMLGILTHPLVHGDWGHLLANTGPVFLLSTAILYFYRSIGYRVLLVIYVLTGVLLWLGGRPSYHIGASGLIYGFAAFLFLSGLLRWWIPLIALSLLVAFLYGGLVWGVLPVEAGVSWEGHLFGAVAGFFAAWLFRKSGPQRPNREIEETGEGPPAWNYRDYPTRRVRIADEDDRTGRIGE